MTAKELLEKLENDPVFLEKQKEREAERMKHVNEFTTAAAPLLSELAAHGYPSLNSVWRSWKSKSAYDSIFPILIDWLPKASLPGLKEYIVRTLGVKWTPPNTAHLLIREFDQADNFGLRWAIGDALTAFADDLVFEDVLRIIKDDRLGRSREMFVVALYRMKNPGVIDILIDLLKDEALAGYAIMALGKLKVEKAAPLIEPFLKNKNSWIRTEAKRALAKIARKVAAKNRSKADL